MEALAPYRILIAEDSRTQAEDLRDLLDEEGFAAEVAVNGREALERVRLARPDLILSDLVMPEMDGFAFCQAIKSNVETRSIPFVLLTQLNTPGGIAGGLQHGADDFIAKPYDEVMLLERIRAILAASAASTVLSEPGQKELPLERASLLLDQREQALRASYEFLEQLIAASPGVVLRGDPYGEAINYISPNVEAVLGLTVEETLRSRRFLSTRIHAEEREQVLASLRRAHAEGHDHWETECRMGHRDGTYRWFYVSVRFDRKQWETRGPMVAHLLDITLRKDAEARLQRLNETLERQVIERTAAAEERARELSRSEAALRQSNATLRTLIVSAPLAIVSLDLEGRVSQWNPAATQIFGWREEDVVGGVLPFFLDDATAEFQRVFASARRGELLINLELRLKKADGFSVAVSLWAAPLFDEAGCVNGVMVMLEDVTERKQLEAQFRQAQKMEAFGQLAGGVAHDFNNMLAVINGYTDLLLLNKDLAPSVRGSLTEIQRAGERASGLTRQLLAFTRQQLLEPKVVDLSTIAADTVRMLRRLIGEDITLINQLKPGLVRVDSGQMEQVLMNLVVNARDAMPRGGALTIETRSLEVTRANEPPCSAPPGSYVMLAVSDNGTGMTEEVRARLFEPFFTTKEPGKGTGLGLATTYGIVTQSGGYIDVESQIGCGTTFRIYIPRVAKEAPEAGAPAVSGASRGTETVLLVEDEAMVRELVRSMLESRGYTVMEAASPGEALHLYHRYTGEIHVLLTDIVMPGMSGRELYEHLLFVSPELKVLYMSGYTDDEVVRHGVLRAESSFIGKPFTAVNLGSKLREVLDS
jgi:PAS domain S-box-containing protein